MRSLLKTPLASLCHWTGAERLAAALTGVRRRPLVLGYHRVVERFEAHAGRTIPAMLVGRAMLEQHLDWLGAHYRLVSLDELGERLESGSAEGLAAVTFDDGYRDVHENAFPLMRRKGIPATVFVVSDLVGTQELLLHDRLYLLLDRALERWRRRETLTAFAGRLELPLHEAERAGGLAGPWPLMSFLLDRLSQPDLLAFAEALQAEVGLPPGPELEPMRPLSWEMLAEMQRGGFTIGSHTRSHALLTKADWPARLKETQASRLELERKLGAPVRHFAYPDGRWNGPVVDAVRCAGYRFGYTTCAHRDPRFPLLTIPRAVFWERSCTDSLGRFAPAVMSCHAHGVFRLVARCRANHSGRDGRAGVGAETHHGGETLRNRWRSEPRETLARWTRP